MDEQNEKLKGKFHFSLTEQLHSDAMNKAGIVSLAAIIRELLRMWVDGEIKVDYTTLSK